jgi:protein-disulfide isomerase
MLLTLPIAWTGCGAIPAPVAPEPAPDGADEVARWTGGSMTLAGLEAAAAPELRALEIEQQLERWELLRRAAERRVDEALVADEAARRGLSVEALLASVEDGASTAVERTSRVRGFRRELRRAAGVVVTLPYPDLPRLDVPVGPEDPAVGPADAALSIVAFGGYQCFYCREVDATLQRLRAQWPDEVRVVYKDFPMSGNATAWAASVAARCAYEQGRFEPMHTALLAHQQAQSDADLVRYAADAGLDAASFDACRTSGRLDPAVARDVALGQQLGVASTPTLFVDGVLVAGAQPYEVLAGIVTTRLMAGRR